MKLFSYIDNRNGYYKNGKFVEPFFSCTADTLQAADEILKKEFKVDVLKCPWISVKIEKIP